MQVKLSSSSLWRIPDFVTQPNVIICITEIDVSHNSIMMLKKSMLRKFGQIRVLNVSFNSIYRIPATICEMQSLNYLDLSHNHLRSLPSSMRSLILLETLKLGGNNFANFPAVLLKMNVTELQMENNNLGMLPLEIATLQCLKVLDISYNKISSLPPTLPRLLSIHRLNMSNNLINYFSLEIFRMPNMAVLTLWGNPCNHVRSVENGDLEDLPEEWRVSLPKLLAAGNPPKQTTASEKANFGAWFFSPKLFTTKDVLLRKNAVQPMFSTADAIGAIQSHPDIQSTASNLEQPISMS
jgi:Leucine-rich repeat (LRR) protein